uniref:Apple domain-containing protein n=1 Tax=Romanomermis culicivorax TaxID=13658 RepID=A0A915I0X1_ROMCU
MQCYKLFSCTHVSYNGNNTSCFLKHAGSKQQILDSRYNSYNNTWCVYYNGDDRFEAAALTTRKPETSTTLDSVLKNFIINKACGWHGLDLSGLKNIASANECAAQCYKIFRCTHFSYNGNKTSCFFKHADTKQQILDTRYDSYNNAWCGYYNGGDRFGAAASLSTTKAILTTTASAVAKPKFTIQKGCEYALYDLTQVWNIGNHNMCAIQCQINKRCTHASYNFGNQICALKQASSEAQIQESRWPLVNSWCILYNGGDRYAPAA